MIKRILFIGAALVVLTACGTKEDEVPTPVDPPINDMEEQNDIDPGMNDPERDMLDDEMNDEELNNEELNDEEAEVR